MRIIIKYHTEHKNYYEYYKSKGKNYHIFFCGSFLTSFKIVYTKNVIVYYTKIYFVTDLLCIALKILKTYFRTKILDEIHALLIFNYLRILKYFFKYYWKY